MAKPPATWRWGCNRPAFEWMTMIRCAILFRACICGTWTQPTLMLNLHLEQVRGPIAVQRYLKVCGSPGHHSWQAYRTDS